MEVNFYYIDNIELSSIAILISKILEDKKKAIIYCQDKDMISKIDSSLWSHGRNKFLPHITIFDKDFDLMRQPIIISDKQENSNNASHLIALDQIDKEFINQFSRLFCFIAKDNDLDKKIKPLLQNDCQINSYKKDSNKWIKIN